MHSDLRTSESQSNIGQTADGRPQFTPPAYGAEGPMLSVVVPTRDEADNVGELIRRLNHAISSLPAEIIFVDDSNDGTPAAIEELAAQSNSPVVLIHRPQEERSGGLGSAVIEGVRSAQAPWVCVMDADLQHPPEVVPQLFRQCQELESDLVVASRHKDPGGSLGLGLLRRIISRVFDAAARLAFPRHLKHVSDPLSGFFLLRKDAVDFNDLRPRGFKILMDILIRFPNLRIAEVPFQMEQRHAGESKASSREAVRYLLLLWHLRYGEDALRFARFLAVGASGLLMNTLLLLFSTEAVGIYYLTSAVLATEGSTLWNYGFTEFWVFSDRRPRGSRIHRIARFLFMNNVALLVRIPLLYVLTAEIGIHYLLSNLISLVSLTVIRYALADTWIWERSELDESVPGTGRSDD